MVTRLPDLGREGGCGAAGASPVPGERCAAGWSKGLQGKKGSSMERAAEGLARRRARWGSEERERVLRKQTAWDGAGAAACGGWALGS